MLVAIDKRRSVSLPASFCKEFGLQSGTFLDLTVQNGGTIMLNPVAMYHTIRLAPEGLAKPVFDPCRYLPAEKGPKGANLRD